MPRSSVAGLGRGRDRRGPARARQLDVAARVVAAVLGGYAVAVLGAVFLARVLPLAPAEATALATLMSFIVYTAAVIWTFAARSAASAWSGLAVAGGALCAGLAVLAVM